jgi:MinD superfamily P-loop ATPase
MKLKRLVVMSGKGGTGKTTVVASLAALGEGLVLADCDVDAPDLHMVLSPQVLETREYRGLKVASLDIDLCTKCGACAETCRFDAISDDIVVDPIGCEGCGACTLVCPEGAMTMADRVTGEVYRSVTRFGPMAHAQLRPGEEASGKLVMEVRGLADDLAVETGRELVLIDGPPGIGCPAISALTGVDAMLIVAEPTRSGRQGLGRAVELAAHFKVPAIAVVNRSDLNLEEAAVIEQWCRKRDVQVADRLPYDDAATLAMIAATTVVEYGDGPLSSALRVLWDQVRQMVEDC